MKNKGRTTLKTLAKASGVSVATASQVIRGVGRISEHTRKRVLSTAEKMNYIPDGRAISMRSGERPEIGMIIQELANPFNAEVVSGVSDYLESNGYFVSVLDARNDIERQKRNIEAFIRSARGGLIWVPAHNTPLKTAELLRNYSIPTITFLRQIKGADFDHIGIKNTEGTEIATEYLKSFRIGNSFSIKALNLSTLAISADTPASGESPVSRAMRRFTVDGCSLSKQ